MVVNGYIIIYFYIKHLNPVKSLRTFNVFYKYNVGLLYVKYDYFIQYAINKGTITAQISFVVVYILYLPICTIINLLIYNVIFRIFNIYNRWKMYRNIDWYISASKGKGLGAKPPNNFLIFFKLIKYY